jgi:cystathionine beta-synthase
LYDLHQGRENPKAEGYKVEGIGEDFLPTTTDLSVIDSIVQVSDKDSFLMTRRLVREEGVFCGGSSGSAVWGALQYAEENQLTADDIVVVILPDSGSRYLSKVFDDHWMRENGFLERARLDVRAWDIHTAKSDTGLLLAKPNDLMNDVVALFKAYNISQVPVVDDDGRLRGLVTEVSLLDHMLNLDHEHKADETIESIIDPDVTIVQPNTPLNILMNIFSESSVVIIQENSHVQGILTKIDILDFLSREAE